jgi:hypothetical protein
VLDSCAESASPTLCLAESRLSSLGFSNFADGWDYPKELSQAHERCPDRGDVAPANSPVGKFRQPLWFREKSWKWPTTQKSVPAEAAAWVRESSFGLAQVFCAVSNRRSGDSCFHKCSRETNSCFQTKGRCFRAALLTCWVGRLSEKQPLRCHALV